MASPDTTPYIDLKPVDLDPQELFDAAVLVIKSNLPDWEPREGNMEVLLLEAKSIIAAEMIYALNRIPNNTVEALLRLAGVVRDPGNPPVVDLKFNMSGVQGYSIPAGVSVRVDLPGGLEPVIFTTATSLDIPVGSTSGVVQAIGNEYTSSANGIGPGEYVELLDSVIYVDSVQTDSMIADGRNPESDEEYFTRGIQRFQRLSETLVLPRHFTAAAMEDVSVTRAFTVDMWNGTTGAAAAGHVTVALYGDNQMLSAATKNAIKSRLSALTHAGLSLHVIDPTITAVNVTATVAPRPGYTVNQVKDDVTYALSQYLSPMTWEWGSTVRRNELISVISNVPSVDYLDTLAAPAANAPLSGIAPLASLGTATITVL